MSREFYRAASHVLSTPWRFAAGGDFAYPETAGPRPPGVDFMNRYSRQIQLASQVDGDVHEAFVAVQHLVAPPRVLFSPVMMRKVVRGARLARAGK
jgi:hypothetical protein